MLNIPLNDLSLDQKFEHYQHLFKALSDKKRLHIMHELTANGRMCVCDLADKLQIPQSKLSYHLKILLDAEFIEKETEGTWSYYTLNVKQVNHILSDKLCCLFRPSC